MMGALQFGVMAACVVLFVPMGMAGYHLSRNKMLFFSGALFITLAVGVHLTPYFPSISNFISSISSAANVENRDSCISFLHEIVWSVKPSDIDEFSVDNSNYSVSWTWAKSTPVIRCGFQKLGRADASDLLNGSWIVVAGDSEARLFLLSLLNLVLDSAEMESVEGDLFKRHSDYQISVEEYGVKLDFVWAPYETNLTDLLLRFKRERRFPDVLVMGSGLWHMLHYNNVSDYGISLGLLRRSVVSLIPISQGFGEDGPLAGSISVQSAHMFWLGMPTLINSMLNSEEKKERMSERTCEAYDREINESNLLSQSGGPLLLLDIRALSRNCGSQCTVDGIHYNREVYEASVQIMLNELLIESQQRM